VEAAPSGTILIPSQSFPGSVGEALFVGPTPGKLTLDEQEATRGNRFLIEVGTSTGASQFEALIGGSGGGLGGNPTSEYIAGEYIFPKQLLSVSKPNFLEQGILDITINPLVPNGDNTGLGGEFFSIFSRRDVSTNYEKHRFYFTVNLSGGGTDGSAPAADASALTTNEININDADTYVQVRDKIIAEIQTILTEGTDMTTSTIDDRTFRLSFNQNGEVTFFDEKDSNTYPMLFAYIQKGCDTTAGQAVIADSRDMNRIELIGFNSEDRVVAPGEIVKVQKIGTLDGVPQNDLVAGQTVFAGTFGTLYTSETPIGIGEYRIYVGTAKDLDSLDITIAEATQNVAVQAYYDALPVGSIVKIYGGFAPTGFIAALGGPISQANYPEFDYIAGRAGYPDGDNGDGTINLPNEGADFYVKVRTVERMTLTENGSIDTRLTDLEARVTALENP
jgi:hypothetical protein